MTQSLTDWDEDVAVDPEAGYQALLRTIRWTNGFGLSFVRCSPAEAEQLIERVQLDLGSQPPSSESQKKIEVLRLDQPIDNFYEMVAALPNQDQIDVLFIKGIEKSLIADIKPGYQGEGEYYNLNTLPRILGHLNLQRERFRDDFDICFIFLVPLFALKYFTRRAPDFFDWRSGVWAFGTNSQVLQQESLRILQEGNFAKYLALSPQERTQKILEIQELIDDIYAVPREQIYLFFELGNLFAAEADYRSAIASYDKALEFKPDDDQAWYNRGIALRQLGRLEEAIASYDKALEFKPDDDQAWYNRGIALHQLGRFEEAITSYDKALAFKPDDAMTLLNRGNAFLQLRKYKDGFQSFEKALGPKPNIAIKLIFQVIKFVGRIRFKF
ncbi:tetratricopeptide repeat protein [Acaryochloris marina]|uniref:TPR domain protein n=1 Tax=Acaryochloris marina (strain MBIC 11017) TaxID=329726 RepID=B0CBG6_ACAM1|nr:tetratricopeptide repeat protein [Acaryochloris marina]ABW27951.1 TPR domain protein [Acaryochloris marina MBIC11017]